MITSKNDSAEHNRSVIIAGGGSGNRMGTTIPKQFLLLQNKPVLMHTIQRFFDFDKNIEVILALPESQINYWKNLCKELDFNFKHIVVEGGATRFHSVKNALGLIKTEGFTAVHDAVRPFVSIETIKKCFETAAEKNNAIPVIEPVDSLRIIMKNENFICNRELIRMVQTPQIFKTSILKKAYEQEYSERFTDDASVVENLDIKITMINGNRENIKITSPLDLVIGEAILNLC